MTMTATKLAELQKDALAFAAIARKIVEDQGEKSPGEWETESRARFDDAMAKGREKLAEVKVARADLDIINGAKALADEIGNPAAADDGPSARDLFKSLGRQITTSDEFDLLLAPFKHGDSISIPKGSHLNSQPIGIKSLIRQHGPDGSKALVTGAANASAGAFVVNERTDIVEMLGRRELTLRDLVSVRRTGSDLVEFVRQISHTNAAAVVPEATSSAAPAAGAINSPLVLPAGGGYKPEGSWAFEVAQAPVKTIAEMAAITRRALADVAQLEGLINDELERDLKDAEETQILKGDGTGENFTGILNTSGIQTQAWTTDLFTTTRKALTKARIVGRVNPTAWVVNPVDAEVLDLLKDGENRYYYGGPQSIGQRTLWGKPVVESEEQPEGRYLLGDFSKAVIWDREQTTVQMTTSHADWFARNLVALLAEERLAFGVTRPSAFVDVDVTA